VNNKIRVYWDVTLCSQADRYQCVEQAAGSVFYNNNNPEDTYSKLVWVKPAGRKEKWKAHVQDLLADLLCRYR